jgi:integrative and conjugative element protein (TIGR02256 family)
MPEPSAVLRISTRTMRFIHDNARQSRDGLETGGVLIGHDRGELVEVTWAGGPGPQAQRRRDLLHRDTAHAQEIVDARWRIDGSDWIGEWHTHMSGLPLPSRRDVLTYGSFTEDPDLNFERFFAVIITSLDAEWKELLASAWVIDKAGTHAASLAS